MPPCLESVSAITKDSKPGKRERGDVDPIKQWNVDLQVCVIFHCFFFLLNIFFTLDPQTRLSSEEEGKFIIDINGRVDLISLIFQDAANDHPRE